MSYAERLEARLRDAEDLMRELIEYHEAREFYDLGKIQMFLRRAWPQPEDEAADNGLERLHTSAADAATLGQPHIPNSDGSRCIICGALITCPRPADSGYERCKIDVVIDPTYSGPTAAECAAKFRPADSAPESRILTVDDEGTLRVYSERDD